MAYRTLPPAVYAEPLYGEDAVDFLVKRRHTKLSVKSNAKAKSAGEIVAAGMQPRRSVCVRLCDGYFFPIGPVGSNASIASHEADCAGLCPDAPTEIFIEAAGSDKIEDAISTKGASYTALPVAFRHRETSDNTCTCHRVIGDTYSLLHDFTLRKGDSVMTADGFRVFQGASRMPYVKANFAPLAKASMSSNRRNQLKAMEHAALTTLDHPSDTLLATPKKLTTTAMTSTSGNGAIHFVEPISSIAN